MRTHGHSDLHGNQTCDAADIPPLYRCAWLKFIYLRRVAILDEINKHNAFLQKCVGSVPTKVMDRQGWRSHFGTIITGGLRGWWCGERKARIVCIALCHSASCTVGLDSKVSPPQSKIHRHLHNMSIYLFIYLYIHIYIFCTRIAQWKGTRRSEKGLGAGNKIVKVEGPTFIIERWEDMGSLKMTPASTPGSRSSQGFPKSPDDSHAMAAKLVRILSFSPVVACVCPALRLMHILYKLDPVETRCSLGDV